MHILRSLWVMMMIVVLAGCGQGKGASAGGHPKGMAGFAVPVVGVKVTAQTVPEKVPVIGSLFANESVDIKSEMDGNIKEILFEEGQKVRKGDVLIVLDPSKLNASLAQAKAGNDMAQITFDRMKSLVDSGAVSKQEFDQSGADVASKKAMEDLIQAQLQDTRITAPFDGTVASRQVSVGQVIARNILLTTVVDADPMKVDFHVAERYTGRLKLSQTVELSVAAYPDQTFTGEVYFIDPQVDEATRTVLVKARVPNPDEKLRPGMFAKLDLVIAQKENAVMVPEIALIPKGEEVFVFIIDGEGKAQMKVVTPGIRLPGMVEITSGLNAGDTVITEGYQKVGPGAPVTVMPADTHGHPERSEGSKGE